MSDDSKAYFLVLANVKHECRRKTIHTSIPIPTVWLTAEALLQDGGHRCLHNDHRNDRVNSGPHQFVGVKPFLLSPHRT